MSGADRVAIHGLCSLKRAAGGSAVGQAAYLQVAQGGFPELAVGGARRISTMSVQCVSCQGEVVPDANNRMPPWCPSCGGNLKTIREPAPAMAVAAPSVPSPTAGHEPERAPISEPAPAA